MVLVSGATGFLGTHLIKYLCTEREQSIRAMYRDETKKNRSISVLNALLSEKYHIYLQNIDWIKADILEIPSLEKAFENIDYVYHCAAWVGNSPNHTSKIRKINVEGVSNMVNVSLSKNIKKFCHVSSIAALGHYTENNNIDEEAPRENQNNRSNYSITKYGGELEVWRASQEGLNVVIVNPGVILGSGFLDSGSGILFSKVLNNTKFYTEKQTGFVFIDDVVKVMKNLMDSEINNQRYILVGENLSFKNIMFKIADVFGKKRPHIKVGKFSLYLIWFFQKIQSLFVPIKNQVNLSTIRKIDAQQIYINHKIKKDLNFDFTSIDSAIEQIYNEHKLIKDIN